MEDDKLDFYSEQPEEIGTDAPRSNHVRESELCLATVRRYSGGCYKITDKHDVLWIVDGTVFHEVQEDGTTKPGVIMNYDMFRSLFVW